MQDQPIKFEVADVWKNLASAETTAGDQIVLRQKGQVFDIRFNGWELMSSQTSASEEILAEMVCRHIDCEAPRVLIGGLGMGYTLRSTLDAVGEQAQVTVCELIPEIVGWNEGPLAALADYPLKDTRVNVRVQSVVDVIVEEGPSFDAIILDTDNGPDAIVHSPNQILYKRETMIRISQMLGDRGVVGVWSAVDSSDFESVLDSVNWTWTRTRVALDEKDDDRCHTIYLAGKNLI